MYQLGCYEVSGYEVSGMVSEKPNNLKTLHTQEDMS